MLDIPRRSAAVWTAAALVRGQGRRHRWQTEDMKGTGPVEVRGLSEMLLDSRILSTGSVLEAINQRGLDSSASGIAIFSIFEVERTRVVSGVKSWHRHASALVGF